MPIRIAELLATLETPGYIARQTLVKPKYIIRAKKCIKKAFIYQMANRCFSLVELISTCPTNWGMTPVEAVKWAEENMLKYYPLGELKTPEDSRSRNSDGGNISQSVQRLGNSRLSSLS